MDVGGVLLLIAGLVVLLALGVTALATPLLLIAAIVEPLRRPRAVAASPRPVHVVDLRVDDEIEARHHLR